MKDVMAHIIQSEKGSRMTERRKEEGRSRKGK
jgi:hypothetical protein